MDGRIAFITAFSGNFPVGGNHPSFPSHNKTLAKLKASVACPPDLSTYIPNLFFILSFVARTDDVSG
jgi:hypothetical protein